MKKTKTIGTKLTIIFCVFSLILCVAIGLFSYYVSWEEYTDFYYTKARETSAMVANLIDGDKIEGYTTTGETDEYYDQLQQLFSNIKKEQKLAYLYLYEPHNTSLTYLLDAQIDTDDPTTISKLGDVYEYEQTELEYLVPDVNAKRGSIQKHITQTEFGPMVMSWAPVFNSNNELVAMVEADIHLDLVVTMLTDYMIRIILMCAAIIVVSVILLTLITRKVVSKPLKLLTQTVDNFAKSDSLDLPTINLNTNDEMQILSEAFAKMATDIKDYTENLALVVAEKERIGAELDVATHIQASMLPCIFPAFPEHPELDIHATMIPAKEVGGDFYDFFLVDNDHLAMVMADVSGKGVPAALFMVIAKTLIKNVTQTGRSPKFVLEKVNAQLCESNEADMFVTVWLGILEISTGKMMCANAGHEYPTIKKVGKDFELIKDKHGFVLAGMEGSRYTEYEILVEPGDKLFLYTDGVAEATDAQNNLFGTDRMLVSLNNSKDSSCEDILKLMKTDIDAFVGDAPQFDDITMLSIEYKRNKEAEKKWVGKPDISQITAVSTFVEQKLEAAEIPMKIIIQMNIAVDEIYSNMAQYSKATEASVSVTIENNCVELVFTDNGEQYDPLEKSDPDITLSAEERQIGGLGIFMVKKSMDSMEYSYENQTNILTITKNFT